MLEWMDQTWDGGQIKADFETGQHYPYIQRMVKGIRFTIQLDPEDPKSETYLENAKLELKLFERDPIGYKRTHDQKIGKLVGRAVLSEESIQQYANSLIDKGRDRHHVRNFVRDLVAWGNAFKGRDLRSITPAQVADQKWPAAMPARQRALKAFCNWLVRREVLRHDENPARALEIPKSKIAKAGKRMGYNLEHVERFYTAMRSQDVRDVLCLRAKYGVHHREIERLILSGAVNELHHPCGIAAVVEFQHKSGDLHRLSIDAQALAAVRRLQARGFAPSKDWVLKLCHKIAEQKDIPIVLPEELRHSFGTWMAEAGSIVTISGRGVAKSVIAGIMGHKSMAMVDRYIDSDVPPMAKVPIKLVHPKDPPVRGLKKGKRSKLRIVA